MDWVIKSHNADMQNSRNPDKVWGYYTGDPNQRRKATELIDAKLFGRRKKKE